jgi:hypothetical protein
MKVKKNFPKKLLEILVETPEHCDDPPHCLLLSNLGGKRLGASALLLSYSHTNNYPEDRS